MKVLGEFLLWFVGYVIYIIVIAFGIMLVARYGFHAECEFNVALAISTWLYLVIQVAKNLWVKIRRKKGGASER